MNVPGPEDRSSGPATAAVAGIAARSGKPWLVVRYGRNLLAGLLVTPVAGCAGTVMLEPMSVVTGIIVAVGIVVGSVFAAPTTLLVMPLVRLCLPRTNWSHVAILLLAAMISGAGHVVMIKPHALDPPLTESYTKPQVSKRLVELTPEERGRIERGIRDARHLDPDAVVTLPAEQSYIVPGPPIMGRRLRYEVVASLVGMLSAALVTPLFVLLTRRY